MVDDCIASNQLSTMDLETLKRRRSGLKDRTIFLCRDLDTFVREVRSHTEISRTIDELSKSCSKRTVRAHALMSCSS
ncbi:hypothetical protein T10_9122 [Trichinella papuae]|uniref:Uncharacterized protein n=1 Tax=Trichinella papuae TaxID=268474 RepID=A0A0V1N0J9_9BILA|nr:hypothetical protein T10_9122 [Trichinella papuae]